DLAREAHGHRVAGERRVQFSATHRAVRPTHASEWLQAVRAKRRRPDPARDQGLRRRDQSAAAAGQQAGADAALTTDCGYCWYIWIRFPQVSEKIAIVTLPAAVG